MKDNIYTLGISAYYHDSAACLLKNEIILAASQEERFTRKKHDSSFPSNAINLHEQACMSLANQMIENMEESNFDTEKFAKMNDLLFSRMTNEQCTDTEGWKKIVSYSPKI